MADEKLLGTQKLDLKELSTDVAEANKLLKSLGTGVNLDMSDVMKDEIKRQIDQLVNAVKRSGSQTKKTAQSISSDIQTVTKETQTYSNKASNALTVVQKGYDQLGRSISETSKNGVLVSKTIVTSDESDIIKRTSTAVSSLATAYRNLAEAKKSKDAVSEAHWQGEVAQQNSVLAGIQQEIQANTHRAETIRTVNNLLQQQKDLEARSQRTSQKLIEESEVEIVKSATNALRDLKKAQANLEVATKSGDSGSVQYWQDTINANNLILDQMADQNFQAGLSAKTQESINRVLQERITLQNKAEIKDIASEEKEELAFVNSIKNAVDDLAKSYKNLQQAKDRKDFISVNHWQNEVNANKANIDSLSKQVNVRQLSAKAQKEINNHLRKAVDLENEFASSATKNGTLFDKLAKRAVRLAAYFVTMRLIGSMWRSATEFAKEYHDALNEIRMVTGMSSKEAKSLGDDYLQLAKEMKVSSRDIAQAAVEYYRQGQSGDTVTENLEWTIKYAKVASLEFKDAAEIMTAAMNSMDQHAQKVTDVFSYLGDASAAGADEIGKAMQKASASAQEAGVSFEWLGAYIATVSEKTRQAPEVIGTAFNTMMARLHNIKATGFNEEDATRVNDIAKALATLPEPLALINSLTGEWVDMSDIFEGIAKQWDTLSDKQRAYVATTMAGTRQQNMFLTLMDDMAKAGEGASRAYELYAGALTSAGNASEKYSIYQESVAASLDGLKASWEELVNLANGGEIFIGLYDTLSKVIRAFAEGTKAMDGWNIGTVAVISGLGLLIPVVYKTVTAFKTLIGLTKTMTMASATSTIGLAITGITALIGVIATLASGWKEANAEIRRFDLSEQIDAVKGNITSLESLIGRYEKLASKVDLTDAEQSEMKTIIEEISQVAPGYADALTKAQGDITQSISIANQALDEQKRKLLDLQVSQASANLSSGENMTSWNNAISTYSKIQKAQKDVLTAEGDLSSFNNFDDWMESLSTDEYNKQLAGNQQNSPWGQLMSHFGFENDSDLFSLLKNNGGELNSELEVLESAAQTALSQIVSLICDTLLTTPDYVNLTEYGKTWVHEQLMENLLPGLSGTKDGKSFGASSFISMGRANIWNYIDQAKNSAAVESSGIEKLLYDALTPESTGLEAEHIDDAVINIVENLIDGAINSDEVSKALDNMKAVFGDKFGAALYESLSFGSVDTITAWQDTLKGLEHNIQETLGRDELVSDGWAESLTGYLEEAGHAQEDIIASYQKFLQYYEQGLVDDSFVRELLSAEDVAKSYETKMGQLNGTAAKLEEVGTALSEVEKTWEKYVDTASVGGQDHVDNLTKIQEEMQKVAQLQTDLATVKTGGMFSGLEGEELAKLVASANNRLFDEFGTTDLTALTRFVGIASDTQTAGMAYLHEHSIEPGAQVLIDDLERFCSESGISIVDTLKESLMDAARIDTNGIEFVSGGYADTLMSSLSETSDGSTESMLEMAAAIQAVTTAIQDGTLTWTELINAMEDGIDTSEMFQLAYKDVLADPTKNQEKWNGYLEQFKAKEQSELLSVQKSIQDEAYSLAESISDLYLVEAHANSDAYKRLYEKYGTTSLSMIQAFIDAERLSFEEGAKLLSDAGYDYAGNYLVEEMFDPQKIIASKLDTTMSLLTGVEMDMATQMMDALSEAGTPIEQIISALWLMNEALESGYLSAERLQEVMADGFNMDDVWNLFDEASILEAIESLEKMTGSSDAGEQLSFMERWFGDEGFGGNEKAMETFLTAQERLEKESKDAGEDIRKNLEIDEDTWKDIVDGGELAADSIKDIQKTIQRLKLKKMEDAGEIMEDTSEAFKLAEKGGAEYQDKVKDLYKSMSDLVQAQGAYNFVMDESNKGTDDYTTALSDLASYVGIDANLLENNMSLALEKLNADAAIAQNTLASLASSLYAVAGSYFDASTWSSGLITLSSDASVADQNIASLINSMLQVAGARIAAKLNADGTAASINVTGLGNSNYRPSGGGGGGGGGGGKKKDSTSEATKLLDHMADAIDKIAKKMEALDSIMSKYDTEGYITGMINALELENELIEEQIELQKENQKVIDEKLATLYVDLSKQSKGSTKYEQLLEEIEKLEDAYNEYTVAILENEAALSANKQEMKEHRESIRDMEIDIREEILSAIEDRIEREEEALDARIDMEEEILDAIIRRHEKERDQILETTEMQIDALEREKDALDEALDARKKAAEEEDKRLELAELEDQYQRIAADPTRAKEALKIQKQIKELRDDIAWDKAEKEVDSQKEALDQQITSLEDYAEYVEKYYDDLLENPRNFLNEVNQILNMSHEQIIAWLKSNSEEYSNSTDSVRKDFESGWRDTLNTMHGITITHWAEVESIIQQGDEAIIQFLKENSQDYREAGRLQAEAYVDAWREKLDLLKKAYEDIVPELPAQKETPDSALQGSGTSSSSSQRTYYGGYDASGEWKSGYGATKADAIYLANKKGIVNPKFSTSPVSKPASTTSTTSGGSSGSNSNIPNTQYKPVQFATGGVADFTGPAWLDGSPSAPERVLSPQQTKLFEALVTSLQKATTLSVPSLPAIAAPEKNGQGSYSFGDIVVNVEKLESDEDYEEMAKRVGEVILRQMNRGAYVGGIRHSF